ncbi:hypothetical protein POPTR_013G128900v4 [Populus trichocarpa]|uniref:Uncharacterized protein n=1 Tax=Populus trichocarpa TaxID=3694 RepID=A0ACC0S4U2_POPTR|nr:hypothetical protein POPTR_013G128900v4 [Populus trichocarpa]
MESKGSEIDEFEKALESALDGSTEEEEEDENEEGEYSDDDEEEEDDDDEEEEEEEENALDSMEQNQQFEYEALAEKKRKTLADAKGEGSAKKARQEDMTGASLAEIEEIMNFGMRKKRRRRMPKRRGRRKGSKNKLSPEITRMLGDATLHYAHGNYEEVKALTVLSEVVKRAPLVADSYHTLGLVHKALGNTEKAMKFYRIAAFLRPKDSSLWKLLFSWHVEQGDIARAWKCLSKAISADPDDISLRSLHALFYDELGDHQRAAESYEQIVRICPEDVEAIKTAAKMHLNCGQIKRCVGILEDYLKGHPSEADLSVIILLADVFMEIDAHNNALQHIEHAQMIYYSGKELPLELMIKAGICHVFLGNIEKAEIHFSALQQENFSIHPEFITKVADAFMSTECFHSALKYYHMLELNVGADNEGEIHVKIAQCYLSLNDRAKAIMFFYKALPMLKDSIDARVALASLILEDAKEDEAISLLSPPKDLDADSLDSNSYMQNPWWLDGKIKLKLCHIYKAKGMLEDFVNTISPLVRESLYVKTLRPKVKKRLTISVLRERISILNVQENDDVFGEVRPLASKSDLLRACRARKLLQKKEEQKAADKAAGIDLPSDYSDDESLLENRVSPLHDFLKDEAHHDLIIDLCKALQSLQRYSEALEIINLTLRLVSDKLPGDREEQLQSLLAQISFNATDPKHGFDYVRSAIQKQPHSIAAWNCYYKITSRLGKSHSKHAKFLRYMRNKHKRCVPPIVISAHQFTMLSHHQDAAREYLEAYKLMPECPLINLCAGTALINLTLGFRLQNKHQCLAQGLAFLYNNLQLTENSQEALYNIARAYHHVGLVSLAASYYEKVLAACEKDYPIPKLLNENSEMENMKPGYCDLRRESAYNLHLIYKNSGAFDLARQVLKNHCTF